MKSLVTSVVDYCGSSIFKRLISDGHNVMVIDNFLNSNKNVLTTHYDTSLFTFYESCVNNIKFREVFDSHQFEIVFHSTGNVDTRKGKENLYIDIR